MNKIIIKRAIKDNIDFANEYLTKLIIDEKKYDSNINENCTIKSFYEQFYMNEDAYLAFAYYEDKIVGYIYGFLENSGDTYINKVSQLDAIYVDSEYRNKGIATELINSFKTWCKENNVKYIELKVCNNNQDAIDLYKKVNFEPVKQILKCEIK